MEDLTSEVTPLLIIVRCKFVSVQQSNLFTSTELQSIFLQQKETFCNRDPISDLPIDDLDLNFKFSVTAFMLAPFL